LDRVDEFKLIKVDLSVYKKVSVLFKFMDVIMKATKQIELNDKIFHIDFLEALFC